MKSFAPAFFLLAFLVLSASVTMAENGNRTLPGASSPQSIGRLMPPSHGKHPALQRGKKIYFYSFDGTYLRTSTGAFYMPPVKLVNHSAEDLRKVDGTQKKMEVKLTVIERRVRQVDVYPDSEK